ncbi:pyridoxal phosphate-dependent aminotransferase [Nakamurella sp. PAMC28650]|uniref:pyridoxal phosphate-dependent aminotransferase n=1 Tax=Nakamurella sp. PAMC28650 TaxID=2762325 RepID=UPI00164D35AC|nr:aminotransferase class I/II-fold pyridoxal phosphate-dependent enzyme [Nakamurella sp. PAMC28650]QNK82151.1 aminotransferase class I/II-fold pyridoxal phosphate-dependent enzyme [Nakamurella sp. PAMC28650]
MTALPSLGLESASIPASGIRALATAAWATPGAVHLQLGEPDFPTPQRIVRAADRAAVAGLTRYAPSAGLPRLREVICHKLARDNHWEGLDPDQVLVTAGGVGGLHAAYRAILDSGDDVLVPDPGWPNLASLALAVGARPVRYRLDPVTGSFDGISRLDAVVTSRTRAIVINTPSNPTGAVFTDAQQAALGEWAAARGIWVISDECYDQLWFDRPNTAFALASPGVPCVTAFSLSKSYAMTGWRVGYSVGPPELIARMTRVQETIASSVNTPVQWAAVEALEGPQDDVATMRDCYRTRRDAAVATASALGLEHAVPSGAFYLWLTLPAEVNDSARFALELLAQRGIATAPGSAFGPAGQGHLRISLAAAPSDIERGLTEIADLLTTTAERNSRP